MSALYVDPPALKGPQMLPKNWKTTAAGLLGGVLTFVAGGMDLKSAVIAVALGSIGTAARDHDNHSTGDKTQQ